MSLQEVVMADIALIEPGEIIPCDGLLLSGHNVKYELGTTGESDVIKKLLFKDCVEVMKKGGRGLAHTYSFMVSDSKVLKGVRRYIVIAVRMKSFNG